VTRELVLNGTLINDDSAPYVIAEVGNNHQGDVAKGRELILRASECGASAVKLQARDNESLFTREAYNRPYDNENSFGPTYGLHRQALELGAEDLRELQQYAAQEKIDFFATPFDVPSADLLESLGVPFYKVASADITNTPLLKHIAQYGKPMLISTGGATLEDVDRAVNTVLPINSQLCVMQCTAAYPADYPELDLGVIQTFRERYPEVVIGYSGHDNSISMPVVAYMLGARIIEKHFTLNRVMKGTDHIFSLEPAGLRRVVRDLTRARQAIGDGIKKKRPSEFAPMVKMAKSLYTTHTLPAGHVLSEADLAIKCPGGGMAPYELENVIGRSLLVELSEEAPLAVEHLGPVVATAEAGRR
jgi:sialic acid synthase